ncbi:hypothetical protein ASD50_14845 [Mesorhizobium sp. Root552]|uniref:hypothetical protein n=1 Tax=Mesorhizobium sp. Root552 TaxID=1736555 RepID=UPI0006FAEEA3|nr:hypothetical protein [Mesorhizobium sp. Root552]KQZ31933.1 hypothetical protein ASD50_14845 [Mesorhizobium sp. Root552]
MPKRERVKDNVFGIAFLIVLLGGVYALWDLAKQQEYTASATQYAANEQAIANEEIARCYGLAPEKRLVCVSKAYNAQRDANRAEDDVSAQKYMANASFWAWVAAWAQSLVAVGGIYFVARTVSQTGEVLRITNGQILIENRPWLKIKSVSIEKIEDGDGREDVSLWVLVENVGSSPALHVEARAKVTKNVMAGIDNGSVDDFAKRCIDASSTKYGNVGVFPHDCPSILADCDGDIEGGYTIFVCVTYRSAISKSDVHHIASAFDGYKIGALRIRGQSYSVS